MENINYNKATWDDIIFEGRNKDYGAYELRQITDRHKLRGIIIAVLVFVAVILAAHYDLFSKLSFGKKEKEIDLTMTDVNLPPPPPPVEAPPPPPPPPPVRPTIKFVEMIAKKDEEVAETQPITKQEEIKETQVATVTQEGDKNAKAIIEDKPGTGPAPAPEAPKEPEIFDRAEVMPSYPGGVPELMKFLQKNIRYPSLARENGLEGKVIVKFYVDTDGTVREPVVLKDGVGGGCGDEAIRVIRSMPKWTPGSQRGKTVKVFYTLPVTFKLQ
ncbi:MAG: TonB family protein [Bacteroidota bacterium]|nr:TonB family protein [Bacteroidota bacterium]